MPDTISPQQPDNDTWQYDSDSQGTFSNPALEASEVSWRALEFIHHPKSAKWYLGLAVGSGLLALAVFFASSQDMVSVGVVVITSVVFGVLAARKPRELDFSVGADGITIGGRPHPYTDFKSFSIVEEDGTPAIWLMPLKRFMPILSLYFTPEQEDKILSALALSLPFEERQPGLVDHLMHRLKF